MGLRGVRRGASLISPPRKPDEDEVRSAAAGAEREAALMRWVSDVEVKKLHEVSHFQQSQYSRRNVQIIFGWYVTHFCEQVFKFERDVKIRSIADIGTGYGWLAIAFALKTDVRVVAVDPDEGRLDAAREIADVFGVAERIDWRQGSLGSLPFDDREVDAAFCIEVLEHTGNRSDVVRDLARITRELLFITTPNKIFPIIQHDTRLPCCHWLPPGRWRDWYAGACGRRALQENNQFWSPQRLIATLPDFERESRFLHFQSFRDYVEAKDQLYVRERRARELAKKAQRGYYRAVSWAGSGSIYMLPNLASTFRRRPGGVAAGPEQGAP
jgi:2-polyprenyl-3-methyl-5-hydroxy-6-metoxy-1,4-benzoquinol methylase